MFTYTDPKTLKASWQRLAKERGGTLRRASKDWAPSGHETAVDFEMGEAIVTLEPVYVHGSYLTIIRAPLLVPAGPWFSVIRRSSRPYDQFIDSAKVEPNSTDDDEERLSVLTSFDKRFIVETTQPEETQALWTVEACGFMLSSLEMARVVCNGNEVRLDCPGLMKDEDFLNAALELVAELANVDIFGLAELEALPGAVYVPPEGSLNDRSLPYVELEGPTPVILGPVVGPAFTPVTRADAEDIRSEQKYTVKIRKGKIQRVGSLKSGRRELPTEIVRGLREVGTGMLRVRLNQAVFQWSRLELNARRLLAGARLLRLLAPTTPSGPYR